MLEEGVIYEECPRCMTSGVLDDENGYMALCDLCQGDGYIPHECPNGEE